jgi:uncharacterized membrane protein
MQKIKNNLIMVCALVLFSLPLVSASFVSAEDAHVQRAACVGANLNITTDPKVGACEDINKNGASAANQLVKEIIDIISAVTGILAVIMIIFAGFRYVTSGGSDEAIKGAKNTIIYAIVGLVVVAFAQIIVHFVLAKTSTATTPHCVKSGKTHKWDSGPNAGKTCKP